MISYQATFTLVTCAKKCANYTIHISPATFPGSVILRILPWRKVWRIVSMSLCPSMSLTWAYFSWAMAESLSKADFWKKKLIVIVTDPKLGIFRWKPTFNISQSGLVIHHSFEYSKRLPLTAPNFRAWNAQLEYYKVDRPNVENRIIFRSSFSRKFSDGHFLKFPYVFRFVQLNKNIWTALFHFWVFPHWSPIRSSILTGRWKTRISLWFLRK